MRIEEKFWNDLINRQGKDYFESMQDGVLILNKAG